MPGTGSLTLEQASHYAGLALKGIRREYPNKPEHVLNHKTDVQAPKSIHPAFYGCFDWHSAVHGHWMLVRLMRLHPGLPERDEIRAALRRNLTAANLRAEAAYLDAANRQSFERMYGWAWLLKLAEELLEWPDPEGQRWSRNLAPLTEAIAERYQSFLPMQKYPIRTGVHPNTAFGLAFALDYARAARAAKLEALLLERACSYFESDEAYPAAWEPGGEDFFSPALVEADLMLRVLPRDRFCAWFHRFLPGIGRGGPAALLVPAAVSNRHDPKLVHLDGLNLSRAWCMRRIAGALLRKDPARKVLLASAHRHESAALAFVASGDYVGEHWLATFAVYLQTEIATAEGIGRQANSQTSGHNTVLRNWRG